MTDQAVRPPHTEPRWLDQREQATWRAFLALTRVVQEKSERQLQQDSQMPHTYYLILAMLSEAPERTLRMSELAMIAGTSQSALSHAATRLEANGWIERQRSCTDKRGYLATLTDQGFAVLQATAPGHVEAVRSTLFDPLTPEQVDQLAEIANAVIAAADCPPPDCPPVDCPPVDCPPADLPAPTPA